MDQRKLKATIDFDIWLSVYMNKISFQSSILNENQLMEIISNFKHRVYNQCGDYSWSIPIWKWCGVYRRLKKNAFFSRSSYLKYFFIAVANWKLRKFIQDSEIKIIFDLMQNCFDMFCCFHLPVLFQSRGEMTGLDFGCVMGIQLNHKIFQLFYF